MKFWRKRNIEQENNMFHHMKDPNSTLLQKVTSQIKV